MKKIEFSPDELLDRLLKLSDDFHVSILDSCGITYLESHYLIAGIEPVETCRLENNNPQITLDFLERKLADRTRFCVFTMAYDFGLKLEQIERREKEFSTFSEPDVFLAIYDVLIIYDYAARESFLIGNNKKFSHTINLLETDFPADNTTENKKSDISSNFSKTAYLTRVEQILEHIRRGDTYQTNLTQQFRAKLPQSLTGQEIFRRLRTANPAPFAAFIKRENDVVVSISPERFFKIENNRIRTSPIKGTRQRGTNPKDDVRLKNELLSSAKDFAENTMIVDLLRNDLGRVCRYGSVTVEKLCDLEVHPTFFHLVSTVSGELKNDVNFSDIIRAVFPCGSITGAPKIRTMHIIDKLETVNRGLSMGAIGYSMPDSFGFQSTIDLNVAIRTLIIRDGEAVFNVGGGIVIDSIPESEYEETLVKAQAIFRAIGADINDLPK